MNLSYLKSPHGIDPVIVEGYFDTTVDRVFKAWTDPVEILQWFGRKDSKLESADINLVKGGDWEFRFEEHDGQLNILSGEYIEISFGERLIFTWTHERIHAGGQSILSAQSLVTITFEPMNKGAFVRLIHENIITEDGRLGVGVGWNDTFDRLSNLLK